MLSSTAAHADLLIVDDTLLNLHLLLGILEARGFRLRTCTSGAEALEEMDARLPDLVLLDIMMPGMDGFEVCRRIRSNPRTARVPVIFLSALDDVEDKLEAFAAGGSDYIAKPFQAVEVLARVSAYLAHGHVARAFNEFAAAARHARDLVHASPAAAADALEAMERHARELALGNGARARQHAGPEPGCGGEYSPG